MQNVQWFHIQGFGYSNDFRENLLIRNKNRSFNSHIVILSQVMMHKLLFLTTASSSTFRQSTERRPGTAVVYIKTCIRLL